MTPSMKAFVTGSHAYGTPTSKSDIDLVVFVNQKDFLKLSAILERDCHPEAEMYEGSGCGSFRLGKVNLLCITDERHFKVWKDGTLKLKQIAKKKGPVTRDFAIGYFEELHEIAGLIPKKREYHQEEKKLPKKANRENQLRYNDLSYQDIPWSDTSEDIPF